MRRLLARLGRGYLSASVLFMALGSTFAAGTAYGFYRAGSYCVARVATLHLARQP